MKKKLEKGLPSKSNLTLIEQIFFIKKTFFSLDGNKIKTLKFRNKTYIGIKNKQYGFFKENISKRIDLDIKNTPDAVMSANIIIKIIENLEELSFNRNFEIKKIENKLFIIDLLRNNIQEVNDIIYYDKNIDISITINSLFIYIFRLNKKTLSVKNNIYIFEKYILIEFKRSKKNYIFYISY